MLVDSTRPAKLLSELKFRGVVVRLSRGNLAIVGETKKEIPVVRIYALWALKLQAGRSQDITDLFSITGSKDRSSGSKEIV